MDGVQLPQDYSHFEEAIYFLPLSSQKFLIANDLDNLILILWGKDLQAVINGNEAEADETGLEAGGKDNGEKSALCNLKDTAILYDLLNLLWLLQMLSLETSIEVNIDSTNFRCPFSTRCNLSE